MKKRTPQQIVRRIDAPYAWVDEDGLVGVRVSGGQVVPPAGSRDPRPKVGVIGAGEGTVPGTAPVEAFLGGWAEQQGLVDLYGDPVRGYAGGYEEVAP